MDLIFKVDNKMFDIVIKYVDNISYIDENGQSYLHRAAINGNNYMISYILKKSIKSVIAKGIDSSLCDKYGNTALHYAIKNNYFIDDLFRDDSVNICNQWLITPIMESIYSRYVVHYINKFVTIKDINLNTVNINKNILSYVINNEWLNTYIKYELTSILLKKLDPCIINTHNKKSLLIEAIEKDNYIIVWLMTKYMLNTNKLTICHMDTTIKDLEKSYILKNVYLKPTFIYDIDYYSLVYRYLKDNNDKYDNSDIFEIFIGDC